MNDIRIAVFGITAKIGGIETYLQNLQKAMVGRNVSFDFLLWHDMEQLPFEEEMIKEGAHVYRELYRLREYRDPEAVRVKELFDRHPEWDGIYLNASRIETTYLLLCEACRRRLPYRIIHCHTNHDIHVDFKKKAWKCFFRATNRRVVTHRFACSSNAGEWMFGKEPFRVLPNSIDFQKYRPDAEKGQALRREYGIGGDELVVGFCGRLSYQKNPEKILDVFRCIHDKRADSRLLLVGDGELMDTVIEKAEALGLTSNVIMTGMQSDTAPFYQMMDCFLFPSRYEGLGIVLLEAQAAGLRCYTSKDVVPSEANVTGSVIYLDLNMDSEKWAERIMAEGFERQDFCQVMENSEFSLKNLANQFTEAILCGKEM